METEKQLHPLFPILDTYLIPFPSCSNSLIKKYCFPARMESGEKEIEPALLFP